MIEPRRRPRARACGRSAWALLTLFVAVGIGLPGCGKEAAREAPPQNGKPAEPAPERQEEQRGLTTPEKDRAEEGAPAALPPAALPPAPASSLPPMRAKPDEKRRERPALPAKSAPPSGRSESPSTDFSVDETPAPPTPQLLRQRLQEAVKVATPDCPSARERKQAICDLASQICQLVDRDPDVASVESYCESAKQRCSEAGRRTAQRCK